MAADVNGQVLSSVEMNCNFDGLEGISAKENCGNGSMVHPYINTQSFTEYSPQNSQMVELLTCTPSRPNVNIQESTIDTCSQESYSSQSCVPNQEFIANLDRDLDELPKDAYIAKLIELTNQNEDTITWYRSALVSRARSL